MMNLFAAAVRTIAMAVPSLVRDLAGLCGVGLVSYGAWLIYPPAGFITAGILLIVGALLIAPAWGVGFLVEHTISSSLMGLPVGAFLYFALWYVFKRP